MKVHGHQSSCRTWYLDRERTPVVLPPGSVSIDPVEVTSECTACTLCMLCHDYKARGKLELGKLGCVLDPFVLAFSEATMRFHNGGYRVAKRDLDIFYV